MNAHWVGTVVLIDAVNHLELLRGKQARIVAATSRILTVEILEGPRTGETIYLHPHEVCDLLPEPRS